MKQGLLFISIILFIVSYDLGAVFLSFINIRHLYLPGI